MPYSIEGYIKILIVSSVKYTVFYLEKLQLISHSQAVSVLKMFTPFGEVIIKNEIGIYKINALDVGVSHSLIKNGHYEHNELLFMKKKIPKDGIVVDVGANIGNHTVLFAKKVGKKGRVFTFEPDTYNNNLLETNVKLNGLKNVTIVKGALGGKSGEDKLYLHATLFGDHRTYKFGSGGDYKVINIFTIDDYFKGFNKNIDFIKMDTQGAEPFILDGMVKKIKRQKHIKIVTEFWPKGIRENKKSPKKFLNALHDFGFSIAIIDSSSGKLITTSIDDILNRTTGDLALNLYCEK
ncbi:MAG: FkbM family methyltransferase [Actinobacteria bacterium]|nr:FkbM family methyltransferase [Actinomycetota bacterium]